MKNRPCRINAGTEILAGDRLGLPDDTKDVLVGTTIVNVPSQTDLAQCTLSPSLGDWLFLSLLLLLVSNVCLCLCLCVFFPVCHFFLSRASFAHWCGIYIPRGST